MPNDKPQKIISLQAENFKVLKAARINAEGNNIVITGPNGAGKSTVLDVIEYALSGKRAFQDVEEPINRENKEKVLAEKGKQNKESECKIVIETDDYIVTRRWPDSDTSYLDVEAKEVGKLKSAQSLLNKLLSDIAFDPIRIAQKDPEEQRELLLDYLGVKADYYEIEADIEDAFEERRDIGRDKRKAESQLEGMEEPDEIPEPINVEDEMNRLQEIQDHNQELREAIEEKDEIQGEVEGIDQEIERLKKKIKQLQGKKAGKTKRLNNLTEYIQQNDFKDPDQLKKRINRASEIQEIRQQAKKYKEKANEVDDLQDDYDRWDNIVEEKRKEKANLFESDDMPIPELSVGEKGIYYKDLPLSQASSAEKIKAGISILVAQNPGLRAFCIRDASLLDEKNRKVINELCEKHDLQAFIETTVEFDDQLPTVRIENGELKDD